MKLLLDVSDGTWFASPLIDPFFSKLAEKTRLSNSRRRYQRREVREDLLDLLHVVCALYFLASYLRSRSVTRAEADTASAMEARAMRRMTSRKTAAAMISYKKI